MRKLELRVVWTESVVLEIVSLRMREYSFLTVDEELFRRKMIIVSR